jgi:hypothetical protein
VIIFFKPFETNLNANYKQHQACTLIRHRRNFYKLSYQATLRIRRNPTKGPPCTCENPVLGKTRQSKPTAVAIGKQPLSFTQANSAKAETSLQMGSGPSKRTQRKTPNLRSTLPR